MAKRERFWAYSWEEVSLGYEQLARVLCVRSYLVLLPINLVNRIAIFLVNNLSYRRIVFGRTHFLHTSLSAPRSTVLEREETHTMRRILHKLMRVPKAPMAHIQPLCLAPSDQVFRVERRIFGRNAQVS